MNRRSVTDLLFDPFEKWVDAYVAYDEQSTPPNRFWPFLWQYMKPFKWPLVLAALFSFFVAFVEVGLIYYVGRLVDIMSDVTPGEFWTRYGTEILLVFLAVLIIRPIIQSLDTILLKIAIQPNIAALGRWRAHRYVLQQPVGWFENDFAGRIANRVTSLPAVTGEFMLLIMMGISFFVAFFFASVALLGSTAPILLVPLVFWLVLYVSLLWYFLPRVRRASRKSSSARSRTLGYLVDAYSNIQSVKLFDHGPHEEEVTKEIFENHRRTYGAENRIFTMMDSGQILLNGVLTIGLSGWALWLWTHGDISVGGVAAATTLAIRINGMTGRIMNILMGMFRSVGVINEGMETVAQPLGMVDAPDAKAFAFRAGKIDIQSVSHHYDKTHGGIDNVSLIVQPGEKVGLVGRSGAGKTTLMKCLLRLLDPERGHVLIDDQDVSTVTQSSLRRQIGVVQQESALLHRTIRDNICYGTPDATEDDIKAAARQALADDFIPQLQDSYGNQGYDAQVGERGVKLSGGQRQRIALARVILKDAPILILDEATSALDSVAEAQVQQALYGMMEGKTVIAIAHRLSTIARMDRIVILDEGRIVEEGTHTELLAKQGLYAELWRYQSGGYLNVNGNQEPDAEDA